MKIDPYLVCYMMSVNAVIANSVAVFMCFNTKDHDDCYNNNTLYL